MSARTLRQIVGVPVSLQAGATLDAAKSAVVLIDYQNEYRSGPLALPDEPSASKAARQLRAWADQAGIAVIHVLHRAPATAPIFALDSSGVAPIAGLAPANGETIIHKYLPSAFTGTGLADALLVGGIETPTTASTQPPAKRFIAATGSVLWPTPAPRVTCRVRMAKQFRRRRYMPLCLPVWATGLRRLLMWRCLKR